MNSLALLNLELYARWYVRMHAGVVCSDAWRPYEREWFDFYYSRQRLLARAWLAERRALQLERALSTGSVSRLRSAFPIKCLGDSVAHK